MAVRVCLDTCAWIDLLNSNEEADLESLRGWAREVDQKRAILLVPAIIACEIACGPDEARISQFEAFLKQPYVEQLDVTAVIGQAAGRLRRQVLNERMKLRTADALVVITADHYRADFIISTDNDMLRMDGKYGIRAKIGPPATGHDQPLFDGIAPTPPAE